MTDEGLAEIFERLLERLEKLNSRRMLEKRLDTLEFFAGTGSVEEHADALREKEE
jgi:DNA-binding response OmpR family regulator